jgi:hypothetical protein
MADIDEVLWQDTKENLMDAMDGDEMSVEMYMSDMKDSGYFDLPDEYRFVDYDDDEY